MGNNNCSICSAPINDQNAGLFVLPGHQKPVYEEYVVGKKLCYECGFKQVPASHHIMVMRHMFNELQKQKQINKQLVETKLKEYHIFYEFRKHQIYDLSARVR